MQSGKSAVTTVGEMRNLLSEQMALLVKGEAHLDRCGMLVKLAAQVNASFAAETEVLRLQSQLKRQVPEIGHLPVKYD